ncbi:interferon regulatory factor 7 [Heteronotia binoei]|uniref:interferon regulatory factor 7 n=1 Tax=Heteronotia binoei TaxID=13085 RepID=UPI00292E0B3D|nr:interferon regulatory factor 7 [Heteronotia binoei]
MQEDIQKCTQSIVFQLSQSTMSASTNGKGSQKVRFFDWLVDQIDSGAYKGLFWLDKNRTTFCIPWKHGSRKDLVVDDYRILQAWAAVSGKYEEGSSNRSKWKTNFRNALKSTRRFEVIDTVQDPNPHRVYRIIPPDMAPEAIPPVNTTACEQDHCQAVPHAEQNSCLSLANGVLNQPVENSYYEPTSLSNVNSQSSATVLLQYIQQNAIPGQDQFNHVGETSYNNNCFIQNAFVNEDPKGNGMMNNAVGNDYQMPANQQAIIEQNLLVPPAVLYPEQPLQRIAPLQNHKGAVISHLDVSIYYRGRLLHETEVTVNSCMFTYNKHHNCDLAFGNPQTVQFPNPEVLPDQKQVKHTLTLLQKAGLLLYEKNYKICAKRLDKCKVYWAFSKQLDNIGHNSQFRCLLRDTETEIFDYMQFLQELKDFHENRRSTSPDYTIYLCFGQCFSAARPKENKLILVKLVPKYCKEYHEYVLREGASSLSSDMSLQISNSLMDLLDQYLMDM